MSSKLVIVTGAVGSGKSTWCEKVAKRDQGADLVVIGLLSMAVISGNHKVGIDLVDIGSGERRRLAEPRHAGSSGLMTDDWVVDTRSFAWGNHVLRGIGHCFSLLLDELGPLEFKRKRGLQEGFRVIERRQYQRAFVVVRSSLMAQARWRWSDARVLEIGEIRHENDSNP